MKRREIARRRLANQFLLDERLATPENVVAALGAVQAQDYPGAKWALAQRTHGATNVDLDRALADGSILRTHVLRPTWHFVTPADIRWMLALTGPRILSGMPGRHRQLGVDQGMRRRANAALEKMLRDGGQLTRGEIADLFAGARIDVTDRQRLAHLLLSAELEGLICSGPLRGNQFTYALLDERVPAQAERSREEAVLELVRRYFTRRGPATAHDFAWWSGLTTSDAKRGLEALGKEFEQKSVDGRSYWFAAGSPAPKAQTTRAHLLPNYDEYFVGFKDRSALLEAADEQGMKQVALATAPHAVFVDGQVVGSWRRTLRKGAVVVDISLYFAPGTRAQRAIDGEVERFVEFLGLPASVA